MSLSDVLTTDNLDSYAEACRSMGMDLWVLAEDGKYGHLLMPSRGAYPLYWHAKTSFDLELQKGFDEFDHQYIRAKFAIPRFNEIWLPFTAYAPEDAVSSIVQRRHWCLVLKGILGGLPNKQWRFNQFFTGDFCRQRLDRTKPNASKPPGLVVIDTVISGRAATEISQSLDEIGVSDYKMLLAVDGRGAKMREPYASHINELVRQGRANLYKIDNIFTEDSHHGLTGITSVVFPQITDGLKNIWPEGGAAGFWHLEIAQRKGGLNLPYTKTKAIVQIALHRRISELSNRSKYSFEEYSNEEDRNMLRSLENDFDVESKELAKDFIRPIIDRGALRKCIVDIDISSSYIAVAYLKEECVAAVLREATKLEAAGEKGSGNES